MADEAYWLYRWKLEKPKPVWRMAPLVKSESAFGALRAAAIHLQVMFKPHEPVAPCHLEVLRVEQPQKWCVESDEGWCVLYVKDDTSEAQATKYIGKDNAPTLCSHYVHGVERIEKRLPDCLICCRRILREARYCTRSTDDENWKFHTQVIDSIKRALLATAFSRSVPYAKRRKKKR